MIIQDGVWSVLEAFAKFGFQDGDGPDYNSEVEDEFISAGFFVTRLERSIHNPRIDSLVLEDFGDNGPFSPIFMEFNGYHIPPWFQLPEQFKEVILKLDPTMTPERWREEASAAGLDITPLLP